MKITLDYTKSLEENASIYFERAKKAKKKAQRAKEAMEETKKKLKIQVIKKEKASNMWSTIFDQ